MKTSTARHIIHDPAAPMMEKIIAAGDLASDPDSTLEDLVNCLKCSGVIAELAANGLFQRTGRPKPQKLRDFANPDQWEQFLIKRRLTGGVL